MNKSELKDRLLVMEIVSSLMAKGEEKKAKSILELYNSLVKK